MGEFTGWNHGVVGFVTNGVVGRQRLHRHRRAERQAFAISTLGVREALKKKAVDSLGSA